MKQTYPLNEADLRAAYAQSIQELLRWAKEQSESEDDPYCSGIVHLLRTGGLAIGLIGWDDQVEVVHNPSEVPKGWIFVYEGITLWEVHLRSLADQAEIETLLNVGVEKAIDAFYGGQSLVDQRRRYLRRNVTSAVEWAGGVIRRMPEHLRPYAQRVLDIYANGNVALRFEVSEDASEKLKREFDLKCWQRELVFGDYGEEFMCRVNIGTIEDGTWRWSEIDEMIIKATA